MDMVPKSSRKIRLISFITVLGFLLFHPISSRAAIPLAPANLGMTSTKLQIRLSWQDNSVNETGFEIQWQAVIDNCGIYSPQAFIPLRTLPKDTTSASCTIPSVNNYSTYYFRVRAQNADGVSSWCDEASGRLLDKEPLDWAARFSSGGDGIVFDSIIYSEYLYTAGAVWNGTDYDYFIARYDLKTGGQNWARTYNNFIDDYALALAADSSGVCVTGKSQSLDGDFDYLTVKYDNNGVLQWTALYNGGENGGGDDVPVAVAVDNDGGVYVSGSSFQNERGTCPFYCGARGRDFATVAYDCLGDEKWVRTYDASSGWACGEGWICQNNGEDFALALEVVPDGKYAGVYVAGSASVEDENYKDGNGDCVTIKYTLSGDEDWIAQYKKPDYSEIPQGLIVDKNSGYVYVSGFNGQDYFTLAYSPGGVLFWSDANPGSGFVFDSAQTMAVDGMGSLYLTGMTGQEEGEFYTTVKYSSGGIRDWVSNYGVSDGDSIYALSVEDTGIASNNGVFLTGVFDGEYVNLKYSSDDGSLLKEYRQEIKGLDEFIIPNLDKEGNLYISGQKYGKSGSDIMTIKVPADNAEVAPAVSIEADKDFYNVGETVSIKISVTEGSKPGKTDFYLRLISSNGNIMYFYDNKWNPAPGCVYKSWEIKNISSEKQAEFNLNEKNPEGSYKIEAILTRPETLTLIGSIAFDTFEFSK